MEVNPGFGDVLVSETELRELKVSKYFLTLKIAKWPVDFSDNCRETQKQKQISNKDSRLLCK